MTPKVRQSRPSAPGLPLAHLGGKLRLGNGSRSLRRLLDAAPDLTPHGCSRERGGSVPPERQGLAGPARADSRGRMGARNQRSYPSPPGQDCEVGKGHGEKTGLPTGTPQSPHPQGLSHTPKYTTQSPTGTWQAQEEAPHTTVPHSAQAGPSGSSCCPRAAARSLPPEEA